MEDTSESRQPWFQTGWGCLLAAALVAIAAATQLATSRTPDFLQDYAAAWAWLHKLPVHAPTLELAQQFWPGHGFVDAQWLRQPHPPTATLCAIPLACLPFEAARWLWAGLSVSALLGAWSLVNVNGLSALATAPLWCVAIVLGTHEPWLALCLAACIRWVEVRPELAGASLGVAIALKCYPAVAVLALILLGLHRAALWAIAAAIGMMFLSELMLGWGTHVEWLGIARENTARYVDQSQNGSLVRLLRGGLPLSALFLAGGCVTALLAPLYFRRRWIDRRAALRGTISVMLLASPLSWRHYAGLAGMGPLNYVQMSMLFVAGALTLLVGMEFLSEAPETLIQLPLVATLFWQWWASYFQPKKKLE